MKTEVISTVKLDDSQKEKIESELKRLFGKNLFVDYKIDKNILGGLIVKQGDRVINLSVVARLKEMKRYLEA